MTQCADTRRLLDQYFVRRDPRTLERARVHLDACPACAAYHDKLMAAEAALGSGLLSTPEQALILARSLPGRGRSRWQWAGWLAPVAVAASAALIILPRIDSDPDTLTARGGPGVVEGDWGLRVLCLSPSEEGFQVRSLAGDASCAPGDSLGFACRNASARALKRSTLRKELGLVARQHLAHARMLRIERLAPEGTGACPWRRTERPVMRVPPEADGEHAEQEQVQSRRDGE